MPVGMIMDSSSVLSVVSVKVSSVVSIVVSFIVLFLCCGGGYYEFLDSFSAENGDFCFFVYCVFGQESGEVVEGCYGLVVEFYDDITHG